MENNTATGGKKFYSVKWYEPMTVTKAEPIMFVSESGAVVNALLPIGKGWQEQTVIGRVAAESLSNALRRKGFAIVKFRAKR